LGLVWFGFDFSSQIAYIDPQQMRLLDISGSPYLAKDMRMSKDFSRMHDQQSQEIIFGCRKLNFLSLHAYPPMFQIDF